MLRIAFCLSVLPIIAAEVSLSYPDSKPQDLTETLHGVEVSDPYRWLEDLNSEETATWVEAQNEVTGNYLGELSGAEAIRDHLTELWNYERYGTPTQEGEQYFFFKNDGLQNQSVLYTVTDLAEEPRILLDPNLLSEDGTVALRDYSASPDGKLLAYAISRSGSDWMEWKVRDVKSGEDLDDVVLWSKFSGASWSKDSKGFYYSRYAEPKSGEEYASKNTNHKVYYHVLGEKQDSDALIFERPDKPYWSLGAGETEDGRFLLLFPRNGTDTKNALFYRDLSQPESSVVELFAKFDASYRFVGNVNDLFFIQTDLEAPRQRLVAVDLKNPAQENWVELIAESEATLRSVSHVGGMFIASYLRDAKSEVLRFSMEGKALGKVNLPGLGSAGGFRGKVDSSETFYSFSSFSDPGTIFKYDIASNESTIFQRPEVKLSPDDYETKQIFFKSKDGTRVPMFVVSKKGIELNGKNPAYLYGYGGFNLSRTPGYSPAIVSWLDMGGVYVLVNLRGGGEYGEEWHEAGMKLQKQNVFDDFIAAAEYLIEADYTSADKLAIAGGSNGGLLVGACMVQRPDLFGACLPAVGVMDMLRFHKFTIGHAWIPEYGSPDVKEEFLALKAYSPYHNLKKGVTYPATMVLTSDHDDRVVPSHSFKFAAALQAANGGSNPQLIRIETKSGHGAGTPTSKRIEEVTDKYTFLSEVLDFEVKL